MNESYNRDELDAELDAIVREAYNRVNKDYLREQAIIALVASGKSRDEAEEWLAHCEIGVN